MTDTPTRVPLAEADNRQLKWFAGTICGIEVKTGWTNAKLISEIKLVQPSITDIPVPPSGPEMIDTANRAAVSDLPPAPKPVMVKTGGGRGVLPHFSLDPKVELTVHKTSDKTRAKDVTIGVNGDVARIQRGQRVSVAYRFYLALRDAIEKQAVETGEIHPQTGLPVKEWQDVLSYPFDVHKMPSDEEIADWHARCDNAVAKPIKSANQQVAA